MQQYRVEFFKRSDLTYIHHDFTTNLAIDDDYIAMQTTTIEIGATNKVKKGQFIRILRDNTDYFFGVVEDAAPGEYATIVYFRPFVALFDEDIMFDVRYQLYGDADHSLENTLLHYIRAYYITTGDTYQNLPLEASVSAIEHSTTWSLGIEGDAEGFAGATVNFYQTLIVGALNKYGIVVTASPDFARRKISVNIGKVGGGTKHIDADLDNVTVKTLKYEDVPAGYNKLEVHNAYDFTEKKTFYVYPDHSWGITDENRISPVVRGVRTATPDPDSDPPVTFDTAAVLTAYDELSGLEWTNLMELECAPNDPLVNPIQLQIGKKVAVHYQDGTYTSILTGKSIAFESITLIFGSQRIQYTKKKTKTSK